MKIGIVSPYDIYRSGGVQIAIRAYQREFKARSHEVRVIAPKPRTLPDELDQDTILLGVSKHMSTPFHTVVDVGVVRDVKEIDAVLKKEKFDILHFHEPWMPLLPVQVLNRSKTINVGTLHAKLPESLFSRSVETAIKPYARSALKKLDYITAVSEVSAAYTNKISDKQVEIIPNGIDIETYQPDKADVIQEYNDDIKTILYIGRLEKRKGVSYLLRAYKELQKQHGNIRLLIAGDGPKRKELETFTTKHHLKRVEFLGRVSEAKKRSLFKSADLFCSPAIFGESFGIVLLEAMAMDTVVVCGNNSGYTSVMRDRGSISLVDPRQTNTFARRLELLLYDDELHELWLTWARGYVVQFDYRRLSDRYIAVYEELLQNAKAAT